MRIVYYGYRDWAINIFSKINSDEKYLISGQDFSLLEAIKPDLIFFIGWSNIVPADIIKKYTCICLHPSPLPKYRGGTPVQHQIINGEIDSAVSFFIMVQGIDTGEILYQPHLSLKGDLKIIFGQIELLGIEYLNRIIEDFKNGSLSSYKQNNLESTFYKRRKESESEITVDEIFNNEPIYLYNKIRALNDPYPNAFIKCKNGKKLFLLSSIYEK